MINLLKFGFVLAVAMALYLCAALLPDFLFGYQELMYDWHFLSRRALATQLIIHALAISAFLLVTLGFAALITVFNRSFGWAIPIALFTLLYFLLTPSLNITAGILLAYSFLHAITLRKVR